MTVTNKIWLIMALTTMVIASATLWYTQGYLTPLEWFLLVAALLQLVFWPAFWFVRR